MAFRSVVYRVTVTRSHKALGPVTKGNVLFRATAVPCKQPSYCPHQEALSCLASVSFPSKGSSVLLVLLSLSWDILCVMGDFILVLSLNL